MNIAIKIVDYELVPVAFVYGRASYEKKPLPIGCLKIVFSRDIFMTHGVAGQIDAAIRDSYGFVNNTQTISRLHSELCQIISIGMHKMDCSERQFHGLDFHITGQPIYFDGKFDAPDDDRA